MNPQSDYFKETIFKLEQLVKREYLFSAFLGIQISFLTGVILFTIFSLVEMLWHFSSVVRTVLFFLLVVIFGAVFIYLFLLPLLKYFKLFRKADYFKTANKVGKHFPDIKDDLVNAMQIVSGQKNKNYYSQSLIDASFQNVYNKTKGIKFESIVNFSKTKKYLLYVGGVFLFSVILFLLIPNIRTASFRLLNYNKEFIPPPKFSLFVSPGNFQVTKGDNISILVKVSGVIPPKVFLAIKENDQTNFQNQQLYADSSGVFKFIMPAVRNSFKYYAAAEKIKSDEYSIHVINRPIIKTLDVSITSPAYSKIAPVKQKDNGNITALLGSYVDLSISSTNELKAAHIEFDDSTMTKLVAAGFLAKGRFRVNKDNNYRIILTDESNNKNLSPINYNIKALYDAYPTIEIIAPDKDVLLANDNRLPLDTKISDDYGFTKLLLHFKLSSSKNEKPDKEYKTIEIPINKNQIEQEVNYIWNLSSLDLSADDIVTYYMEVFDNDNVSGPKSAKSPSFTVRVPSLNELLTNADKTQNESEQNLSQTLKEAKDLKQKMDNISQELKQDKKDISWQEKQKVQQAVDQFKKLQDKVNDVGKNLEKMQQNLQQNNLISKETLQKYMELQKLFDQIANDDLKKAMEKLQDILQNMNRKQTQDAMENMKFNEDQFKNSIERTMNLLKKIQIEQKMDELVKRTEQITKDQNELKNDTKNSSESNQGQKNQLSNKQDEISQDLKEMSKQLDELSKKMDELKDMPKDQLAKLKDQFNKQQNLETSQKASQDIKQSSMQQAEQNQSQISENMNQMKQQMQQLQKSMAQQSQMQAFKDMMKITNNLLTLSKDQEQLQKQTENMNPNSSSFDKNAREQKEIQSNLDKVMQQMSSLSQKTFSITPEMGKSLGDAQNEMKQSMQGMQNRNANQSANSQNKAMASLNEAAEMMKNSMESMMKGSGQGGGMMSLMQQLQQMSGQQMSLNNLTQMLQKEMSGNLSAQQQAELQKIAQQQEMLRKSLEQLNKEAQKSGETKKIPADLNDIAKKMQEIVKNLNSDNLNEKTVQQQEHILSRLLDAQRSINERDFENKRESIAGKDEARQSPSELNLSNQKDINKIKDELNKAAQEGYKKDYEDLIKKYYEALQKENVKN
ncbi:MAG TPA: DUF4175 family protein [Ignavibacteriaceae bacterium]|nr:DUF4175 family protein [Ignavibacteriaceae bacterium]